MPARPQERAAVSRLIETLRMAEGREYVIAAEGGNEYPDFKLTDQASAAEQWVEVVEAVESGAIRAAESKAERIYRQARQEYLEHGEEVVFVVSDLRVEEVVPAPGYGVTGILTGSGPRRIWPEDWIHAALRAKAAADRYDAVARSRTWLVIDCTKEPLVGLEDIEAVRAALGGNTLGFALVWCVSPNWSGPKARLLAP